MFLSGIELDSAEMEKKIQQLRALLSNDHFTADTKKQAQSILDDLALATKPKGRARPSQRFFESVLNTLPGIVCHLDTNLNYVYANAAFQKWYSFDCKEIIGKHLRTVVGDKSVERLKPYLDGVLQGKEQEFEVELEIANGGTRWIRGHYIPVKQDGVVIGFNAVVENISERKQHSLAIQNQRSFYSNILNSMEEGFAIQDKDAQIIHFNPAATAILGLSEDQLRGRSSLDPRWRAIHEDGSPFPGETHPAMVTIKTGKPDTNKVMGIITPDGKLRWLRVNAIPFQAELEGKQAAVLVTFSDITSQIEHNQFLSNIMTNSPGVIYQYCLHPDGTVSIPFMSAKAKEIYERSGEEIRANSAFLFEIMSPSDQEQVAKAIQESAKDLSLFHWNGQITLPSGNTKWLSVTGIPYTKADGCIIWDGIILDQTKQHLLEEQLAKEQAITIHSMRLSSLGEMSAGIAHEINNPLAIISGLISMVPKSAQDPAKLEDKLFKINQSIDRIAKIVRGLKKFSRTDLQRSTQTLSVSSLIRESMVFTEIQARRGDVLIELQLDDELYIQANEVEIEQVLINLINNAIDAVKSLPKRWVRVETRRELSELVLRITDSGKGIPPSVADKIFDPFFTTKPIGQGTGLGLSISRGIILDHGGTIAVLTNLPNTCFEIRLPLVVKNAS